MKVGDRVLVEEHDTLPFVVGKYGTVTKVDDRWRVVRLQGGSSYVFREHQLKLLGRGKKDRVSTTLERLERIRPLDPRDSQTIRDAINLIKELTSE